MNIIKTFLVITLTAMFYISAANANSYYINSRDGNDNNNGLSPETPWKTLKKINSMNYSAGDKILLASGTWYTGQLAPKGGDGVKGNKILPIVIASYGEGKRPRINGEGKVDATVYLHNVEGWEIRDLEITNKGEARKDGRFGVLVVNEKHETARHIVLKNLYVHDVNGTFPKRPNTCWAIQVRIGDKHKKRFDGVLIENCHIKNCSRNGISVGVGPLRKEWFPSINVVVRKNLIEGVGGDGIVPRSCDGALIEWNTMRNCPRYGKEGGAAAGIWPWSCDNTVLQFNEVSDHKAWADGQAYDCDYNCNGTIYQYNYSYNNEGGFILMCSPGIKKKGWLIENAWNRGSIVRYNLSINDGSRTTGGNKDYKSPTFNITGETTQNSKIYSNLIVIPKKKDEKMDTDILTFNKWGGKYPINTVVKDNIFYVKPGQKGTFDFGKAKGVSIKDNIFIGDVQQVQKTDQVVPEANNYLKEFKEAVLLKGDPKSLRTFREFLKKKGNPHLKAGLKIKWADMEKNKKDN